MDISKKLEKKFGWLSMGMIRTLVKSDDVGNKVFFLQSVASDEVSDFIIKGSNCISLHRKDNFGSETKTIFFTKILIEHGYWIYSKPMPIYCFADYPLLKTLIPKRYFKQVDEKLMDAIYYKYACQDEELERLEGLYSEFFNNIEVE